MEPGKYWFDEVLKEICQKQKVKYIKILMDRELKEISVDIGFEE